MTLQISTILAANKNTCTRTALAHCRDESCLIYLIYLSLPHIRGVGAWGVLVTNEWFIMVRHFHHTFYKLFLISVLCTTRDSDQFVQ